MSILSPLPGTFYTKPAPDQPDYKSEGDVVAVGETIGLVEVMKNFIEVKAEVAGTFKSYSVANETAVTPGQELASLGDA